MSSANRMEKFIAAMVVLCCITTAGAAELELITTSKSNSSGFRASLQLPQPVRSLKQVKSAEFIDLGWPGASKLGEIGKPALPVVRKLFVAPVGANVSLKVFSGRGSIIDLGRRGMGKMIMPVQEPVEKLPGARSRAWFRLDIREYIKSEYAPADRVVIEEVGTVRGHRLMLLEMRPVSYNPTEGRLRFWPRLSAEVRFKGGLRGPNRSVVQGLDAVVANPEILPGAAKVSANYLIVIAQPFEAEIQRFATAKQAQGYVVTTCPVTPGAANTTIKSYIQELWATADAPDYILLVGDTDTIPNWIGGGEGRPNTDLPYTCMDAGDDWYPDIAIGRFPVRSVGQLADVIDKTLAFEDGLYADTKYPARAVFMASEDEYSVTEGTHNWVIDSYMTPYEIASDKLYCHTYNATTQQSIAAFNEGRLYGIYSGHGDEYYWADGPAFQQSDIRNLANGNMYPFVISFACVTGSYMLEECFTETWLLAPGKGAVAVYGSSVNSYWTEDDQLERDLFQTLFDDDIREIAPCWNAALMRYLAVMGAGQVTRRYFEMYNLMGDPSAYVPLPRPGTGLKVDPGTNLESTGPEGGGFTPVSTVYTLKNRNEAGINFEITADQPWVSIDAPAGYLKGSAAIDVTVSIGVEANTLPAGRHQADVSFVNTTDHDGDTTRHVTLDVGIPTVQYSWNMDEDPGWITEGLWAWGWPAGGGGEHGGTDPTGRFLNVYGYNLDGDYENNLSPKHLVTAPIDCSGLSRVSLRFQRWLGVEKNSYDRAEIQVSNDGTNWTTIWENPASDIADTTWVLQEFDISDIADDQQCVFIRWTMGPTDSSYRFCGWNIDDVEILGIAAETFSPISQTFIHVQTTAVTPGNPIGPITIEMTNNTDSKYEFIERPYVVMPSDDVLWFRPKWRSMPAGHTRRYNSRVRTSPWFGEGRYTYGIMLIDIEGNEIDNDSFEFDIVARDIPGVGPSQRTSRRVAR